MKNFEKKERMTCKDYCSLWDFQDRDCEAYGENHPLLRNCPVYHSIVLPQINKMKEKGLKYEAS